MAKVLIGRNNYWVKRLEDFHTQEGIIKREDLSKDHAVSSKGKRFAVVEPNFVDYLQQLQRGPQVICQKDIGLILAKTGVNNKSTCVDAGGGSGALCLSLANICKKVVTYEVNADHVKILRKNVTLCSFENITVKQGSVYDGIVETEVDLVTLDLPEPWRALDHALGALKHGGFLVVYAPQITQVQRSVAELSGGKVIEVVELLERQWSVGAKICRPEFSMLGHTGFLLFIRKV